MWGDIEEQAACILGMCWLFLICLIILISICRTLGPEPENFPSFSLLGIRYYYSVRKFCVSAIYPEVKKVIHSCDRKSILYMNVYKHSDSLFTTAITYNKSYITPWVDSIAITSPSILFQQKNSYFCLVHFLSMRLMECVMTSAKDIFSLFHWSFSFCFLSLSLTSLGLRFIIYLLFALLLML